ncbi:hypothetical protein M0Q50_02480 [bacterium]|jgi:hypothetical protein|nr:hypothetical protein [bacterium]
MVDFFIEYWNKSICLKHTDYPQNVIMIYDPIYVRKLKLNSLNNNKKIIPFTKTEDSIVLFYQDHKNGLFDVNYELIWSVLNDKYYLNDIDIKPFISSILRHNNIIGLNPICSKQAFLNVLLNTI